MNGKEALVAVAAFGALAMSGCSRVPAGEQLPLKQIADVPLPGNPTRLDYQSLDPQRHLLFIAHLGDSDVVVVDTKTRHVVTTVPELSRVHGVLAVPALNTVYASATGTNEVVAFDERTFRIKARTDGGVYPDGIAYDPIMKRLFISDERGNTETVIDALSDRRVATIPLGGEVGNTQYDPVSHHMFVNVQTLGQLVEIDPHTNAVLKRTALPGCDGNHGLLIDERQRRAFIACEGNAVLLWVDMKSMRLVNRWKIGDGPDVLALDPQAHRLYVAAESGVVSVFSDGSNVERLAQAYLAPAAHTVAVDRTRTVYFPLEDVKGKPVLRMMREK